MDAVACPAAAVDVGQWVLMARTHHCGDRPGYCRRCVLTITFKQKSAADQDKLVSETDTKIRCPTATEVVVSSSAVPKSAYVATVFGPHVSVMQRPGIAVMLMAHTMS